MTDHAYGWIKDDAPPERIYRADPPRALPARIDLRDRLSPWIWDQRKIGSCVFQAACNAAVYASIRAGGTVVEPSRLFPYWNARLFKDQDTGAKISWAIRVINEYGLCDEALWPYREELLFVKPNEEAYKQAQDHQLLVSESLRNSISDMKCCLADGWPFIFGLPIFESFETPYVLRTGRVPIPNEDKEELKGFHAMLGVGYGIIPGMITVLNSWGKNSGDHAYYHIPEQVMKSADDVQVIKRME